MVFFLFLSVNFDYCLILWKQYIGIFARSGLYEVGNTIMFYVFNQKDKFELIINGF